MGMVENKHKIIKQYHSWYKHIILSTGDTGSTHDHTYGERQTGKSET